MATSGSSSVAVTNWDTLIFSWSRSNYSISGNYSDVYWEMKLRATNYGRISSSVPKNWSVSIAGNNYSGKNYIGISNNSVKTLASGTTRIYHNADGNKSFDYSFRQEFNITWSGSTHIGTYSGSGSGSLDTIPRYADITSFYISSAGLNSLNVTWSANANCDWLQYSINGGNWVNTGGSTFTIGDLNPNTNYSVRIQVRRADSQLWTTSGTIYGTTKDIARITSASDINFGDSIRIKKSNPSNSLNVIRIETLNPTTTIKTISQTSDDMTFTLTDEEWDILYKKLGKSNDMTIRYVVDTKGNSTYSSWVDRTLTLTGNMKTARIGIGDSIKRAKVFFGDGENVRRAVGWMKIDGEIKRVF